MKKRFVCLANSWKIGGRCLAGIEVLEEEGGAYSIVKNGKEPIWVRPVSQSEHGSLEQSSVSGFSLLDILEVECTQNAPVSAQIENWHFRTGSIKKVGRLNASQENLNRLSSQRSGGIFGNHGKAVHVDHIAEVGHSLILVQAEVPKVHYVQKPEGKKQLRLVFSHEGTSYDLAVTDPDFAERIPNNLKLVDEATAVYVCLSLAVPFNEFHAKLVAGVILC